LAPILPRRPMVDLRKRIGCDSEDRVMRALYWLQERGEIDGIERSRNLDLHGVDVVVVKGKKKYKLQVKSSEGGVRREHEEHPDRFSRREDIIFIVPECGERREDLGPRIMTEIEKFEERIHNVRQAGKNRG